MTLRVCLYLTLLVSTATGSRSSIVGGEDATPGKWPWMVYLYTTDGKHNIPCGGSLVNNQWILTAGHCLKHFPLMQPNSSLSYALLGELKLRRPSGVRRSIGRFLLHPAFLVTSDYVSNDIALVQLQEPVPISNTLAPVALPGPRDFFTLDSECWVTGWGKVAENQALGGDQTLQQLQLPLVDDDTCRKTYPKTTNNQLCAGYVQGGKDTCQGDSGGPLVCKSFGQFVQVGVVSFGRGCARFGYPGVYTRVYNYMQFIEDSIHKYI